MMTIPGQRTHHEHGWWWTIISDSHTFLHNPFAKTPSENPFTCNLAEAWCCRNVKDISIVQNKVREVFEAFGTDLRRLYRFYVEVRDGMRYYYAGVSVSPEFISIYEEQEHDNSFLMKNSIGDREEQWRYVKTFQEQLNYGKSSMMAHTIAMLETSRVHPEKWQSITLPLDVVTESYRNNEVLQHDIVITAGKGITQTSLIPKPPQKQGAVLPSVPQKNETPQNTPAILFPSPHTSVKRFKSRLPRLGGMKTG